MISVSCSLTLLKILCVLLLLLSVWIVIPAPALVFMPFTIVIPEYSPILLVFTLLLVAIRRRLWPWLLVPTLLFAWPLTELPNWNLRRVSTTRVEPEKLPLHILYYPAATTGLHLAVIDIYGGAWRGGLASDDHLFDSYLAARGYPVYAIEYRHVPAHFPAQLEDVRAAIAWIHEHDPRDLVLCGRSSGGELALLAAYEGGPVPIRGVIGFYPPSDLTRGYNEVPSPDPIGVRQVLEAYIGGTPSNAAELYRQASAITYANRKQPPTLLIQGGRDHLVLPNFTRDLHRQLLASGTDSTLLELPWSDHAFDFAFGGLGYRLAIHEVEQFLARVR